MSFEYPHSVEGQLPVRRAAKVILFTDRDEIVTVTGKSGRINLPGGGVDDRESVEIALQRELYEELGLKLGHLGVLEAYGRVSGEVTSNGRPLIAEWNVYGADLKIPVVELYPQNEQEIRAFGAAPRGNLLNNPQVSTLAKQAITLFT